MTISFSNTPFNVSTSGGFDDPWQRRDHHVQRTLRQLAPRSTERGRSILWRCLHCQHWWYEIDASHAMLHLSYEQFSAYAFQLGFRGDVESLPTALCPECSCRLLGGILRIEEQLSGQGYRFVWRKAGTSEVWVYQTMLPDEETLSQLLPDDDPEPLLEAVLCHPTDLLLPTSGLSMLLEQLIQLPGPVQEDVMVPFSARHLRLQANQVPKLPPGYLRGFFWLPGSSVPDLDEVLLIALASVTSYLPAPSPEDLLRGWKTVFRSFSQSL